MKVSGINWALFAIAIHLFSILGYVFSQDDFYNIDPRVRPRVLVNLNSGTTNDRSVYVRGILHPNYFLEIDGKFVDVRSIKALQSHWTTFDVTPKKNDQVLFRCRERFRIGKRQCDDGDWLEGQVLKTDGDDVEILAAHCDNFRMSTTYDVVKDRLENLRRIDDRSSSVAGKVVQEMCAGEKRASSVFYQFQPECKFFKFRLAYPRQSYVQLETDDDGAYTMIRTDIEYQRPPIVPDRVPSLEDLSAETRALIRKGSVWKMRDYIQIERNQFSTNPKITYAVALAGKKRKSAKLEDVRIIRGKVMNLCESVADDLNGGSHSISNNPIIRINQLGQNFFWCWPQDVDPTHLEFCVKQNQGTMSFRLF